MDTEHIKYGQKAEINDRTFLGEGQNTIIEDEQYEFDKNCAVRVKTMAETHHSVTNTSGNHNND